MTVMNMYTGWNCLEERQSPFITRDPDLPTLPLCRRAMTALAMYTYICLCVYSEAASDCHNGCITLCVKAGTRM